MSTSGHKLIWPLEGLWAYYHVRGQLSTAQQLGEQLLHLAHQLQSPIAFAVAHQTMGLTLFYLGQFSDALAHLEEGIAHYVLKPPRLRHLRGVHDQGVMCHAFTALASCLLGYPDQALLRVDTMIELAEEALHPFSLAFERCAAAVLHQCRQEAEGTQQHAEIAIELSAQEGFPLWHAMGTVLKGWALTRRSRVQEGIGQIRNGLKRWRHTGAVNVTPYFLALLADAYREAGQVQDGLTALDEARQVMQETGERWWEAEAYRLTGEMLLIQSADHADQAEHLFRQAIEVAHELGAKLCELRAAISLSQLLDRQGQTATAIDQLRDVYNWFTDGFDTLELQAARHQLETLQNHLHTVALNIRDPRGTVESSISPIVFKLICSPSALRDREPVAVDVASEILREVLDREASQWGTG